MIVWLNQIPRISELVEPVLRVGYLPAKDYPLTRTFEHFSFSCLLGNDIQVKYVDSKGTFLLNSPHCLMALPGETHSLIPLKPVNEFFFVYSAESAGFMFKEDSAAATGPRILNLNKAPRIIPYLNLVLDLLGEPLTSANCCQIDLLACAMLADSFLKDGSRTNYDMIAKLSAARDFIVRHCHLNLDLEAIAQKYGMSYATFRRLWKQQYDNSPHVAVMNLRNHKACEFLKYTDMPIVGIAAEVGYPDQRYFSRFFYSMNRMTPREYRNRHRFSTQAPDA